MKEGLKQIQESDNDFEVVRDGKVVINSGKLVDDKSLPTENKEE